MIYPDSHPLAFKVRTIYNASGLGEEHPQELLHRMSSSLIEGYNLRFFNPLQWQPQLPLWGRSLPPVN
jgi:hypothetical protein